MKQHFNFASLIASAILISVSFSCLAENKEEVTQEVISKTNVGTKSVKIKNNSRTKAAYKTRMVNINGASHAELKSLPGIGDAEADKIIAGRPYPTKAHLVTRNIIDRAIYENIKKKIVAKQPYKDISKNAALYRKNK